MKQILLILSILVIQFNVQATPQSIYDVSVKDISGKVIPMSKYKGRVLVIVNTASQCGYTPQLKGLEKVYRDYKAKGLDVLAFPSNDFKQDPDNNQEILSYAQKNYDVTFPFFEKNSVTGGDKQPLYQVLTTQQKATLFKEVQWNFEKFLVNRKGEVVGRFAPRISPDSPEFVKAIESALNP